MIEELKLRSPDHATGFSIWLIPERSISQALQPVIDDLSECFGTPRFSPHITLLGQLDMDESELRSQVHEIADSIECFEVEMCDIEFQDVYFRSMFCKLRESDTLVNLNRSARAIFDRQADPPFYPHMSLLYSYESEINKLEACKEVDLSMPKTFDITGIEIVRTQGQVSDWISIEKIDI